MNVHMVIGAGYGDEGKGTITAKIAAKDPMNTIVVLNNGGAQRGHSVFYQNKVYNNKHFGSASCLGSATFFGPMFIMDPMQFTQEYNLNWIKNSPAVYRHKDCRWVTPFDIIANQNEAILEKSHHTCGMGIWKTIQRYEIASLQLALGKNTYNKSFDEFMTLPYDEKVKYLNKIADYYSHNIDHEYRAFFEDLSMRKGLIDHFIVDCEFLYKNTRVVDDYEVAKLYKVVIFENGQGLAIGDNGINDVNKTPSNTGLKALDENFVSTLNSSIESFTIHYVSRTYETRHGDDNWFNSVDKKLISSYIKEDENNHYNQWQGEFKYNTLNSMLLTQRILKDLNDLNPIIRNKQITKTILELTHCDEIGPENIVCNVVDEIRCTDSANIENINLSKLI